MDTKSKFTRTYCPGISWLTKYRIIAEAKRRFDLYTSGKDKTVIHPSLRTAIYGLSVRYGDRSEYEALKKEYRETTSIDGKEIVLRAMGRVQTPELISDYFEFLFKEVATQDVHTGASALAANTKTRYQLWKYIQDNFDPVKERLWVLNDTLNSFSI